MTEITSKVCVVGDFAVGKTSVVERFVNNQFSEKYLTTVGVKIDTKEIEFPDLSLLHKLVIWDVAGSDRFAHTEFAYLRGAGGYVFVADGTRPPTLHAAQDLRQQVSERFGDVPSVLLVNKRDLTAQWDVSNEQLSRLEQKFDHVYRTSAKTGDEVESALTRLARLILDADLKP